MGFILNWNILIVDSREYLKKNTFSIRYPVEVRYFIYTFFSFFLGMCEALWQPDMNTEEIFECIAQALTNALDRDASSGWGAVVHIIEADKITTKKIKTRMDWNFLLTYFKINIWPYLGLFFWWNNATIYYYDGEENSEFNNFKDDEGKYFYYLYWFKSLAILRLNRGNLEKKVLLLSLHLPKQF